MFGGNDCLECSEVPSIAREVQDLHTKAEYYERRYKELTRRNEKLHEEIEQLRKELHKKEETLP